MHGFGHTLHTDVSEEKCLDVIHGLYIQSESANIALEHNFLQKKTGGTDCPSNSPSLPLSMSSCNNELDHTSDQRKITMMAKTFLLPSYYSPVLPAFAILLNHRLLIPLSQFSVSFVQKLLPIF